MTAAIQQRVALATEWVPELASHAGRLLLLRPDHYVVARFRPAESGRVEPELNALLDRTWPDA